MTTTILYVKNMCCDRCIETVRYLFKQAGYNPVAVTVGEVIIAGNLSDDNVRQVREILQSKGFGIAERSDEKVAIRIHALLCKYLVETVNNAKKHMKLSVYLTELLHCSYFYLSKVFAAVTGLTIEKYYIRLKMEKAKELIMQGDLSLAEIASQLGYGSQQTFSTQFKKQTGKTPGEYKVNPLPARIHWDHLLPQHFKQNRQ